MTGLPPLRTYCPPPRSRGTEPEYVHGVSEVVFLIGAKFPDRYLQQKGSVHQEPTRNWCVILVTGVAGCSDLAVSDTLYLNPFPPTPLVQIVLVEDFTTQTCCASRC